MRVVRTEIYFESEDLSQYPGLVESIAVSHAQSLPPVHAPRPVPHGLTNDTQAFLPPVNTIQSLPPARDPRPHFIIRSLSGIGFLVVTLIRLGYKRRGIIAALMMLSFGFWGVMGIIKSPENLSDTPTDSVVDSVAEDVPVEPTTPDPEIVPAQLLPLPAVSFPLE